MFGNAADGGGVFTDFRLAFGFRLSGDFTGRSVELRAGATNDDGNPSDFDEVVTSLTRSNDKPTGALTSKSSMTGKATLIF